MVAVAVLVGVIVMVGVNVLVGVSVGEAVNVAVCDGVGVRVNAGWVWVGSDVGSKAVGDNPAERGEQAINIPIIIKAVSI